MFPQIKLKSGVEISRFEKTGVQLSDGSRLDADAVIFATGYGGDMRDTVAHILPQKSNGGCLCSMNDVSKADMLPLVTFCQVRSKLGPMSGLNDEFEINGLWRYSGQSGLYFMAVSTCSLFPSGD
jgi:putative flavoprotein involved in K+ transport